MAARDDDGLAASVNADLARLKRPCRAESHNSGLGMIATRSICAGEVVMVERPLVLTPCEDARPFTCAACFADSRAVARPAAHGLPARWPRRCAGCRQLRFCSAACEADLAHLHGGVECAALAGIARDERATQQPAVRADAADVLAQTLRILAHLHAGTSGASTPTHTGQPR
jgi:hypothetical protein